MSSLNPPPDSGAILLQTNRRVILTCAGQRACQDSSKKPSYTPAGQRGFTSKSRQSHSPQREVSLAERKWLLRPLGAARSAHPQDHSIWLAPSSEYTEGYSATAVHQSDTGPRAPRRVITSRRDRSSPRSDTLAAVRLPEGRLLMTAKLVG